MTIFRTDAPPIERIMCGDSLGRSMLAVLARDPQDASVDRVPLLGRRAELPGEERRAALARDAFAEAVPYRAADGINAGAVASWIAGRYPAAGYPAVVLGSPHGAAVHLAAALGAAWLPTSFRVTFSWPGGDAGDWPAARRWGAGLAARILRNNPGISVRQVHDPLRGGPAAGTTVALHLRWRKLPAAYRDLLSRIDPGGASLLLRDLRTWPVAGGAPGYGFQLGSPIGGWTPRGYAAANPLVGAGQWPSLPFDTPPRYAETAGEPGLGVELARLAAETGRPAHRALYANPATLSACVADLYRQWLRDSGAGGERCVVEAGRLLDPWQVLAGGLVPYWCESSSSAAVGEAEWWLAGSEVFDAVTVLPEAPGRHGDPFVTLAHWRSLTSFGRHRGVLDRRLGSRYPMRPPAGSHATRVLTATAGPPAAADRALMTVPQALRYLRRGGADLGMLVS